ncbi:hypothetical protein HAX54_002596, partial [Datura stramonium]|nr:hypothetical protein [Datura stramonium]
LEASKIHPTVPEEELISAFIQIQEGLYYDKLLGTCSRNFSDLICIGKEIESGIQGGRIVDNLKAQVDHQIFQQKISGNLQGENNSACMTMHPPQYHQNHKHLQSRATSDPYD